MVWSAPSLLSVESLIQNATNYLINNCPLPPDDNVRGLFSQPGSGVQLNQPPGTCMILPLPLEKTPRNLVSSLIDFDKFELHPSEWDHFPDFEPILLTTLINRALLPYPAPLHQRMRDFDDGKEGIVHEMLSILLQRLSPLAHLILIQLWNEEEEYETGECWAALQALSTTKSMTDRNFCGENVQPDIITIVLQESLLVPVRDDVHVTDRFVRVSPVDAKGSAIYKSLISESGTMTQDIYMDSVLDRAEKGPKWLHYFFQKDCNDGVRGSLQRGKTLQMFSSVSMPFYFSIIFH